jgi:8-oxo-dGTP pyrophosphatase MutT (NUDIX family)
VDLVLPDAVAALIVPSEGRYVMQLRDERPDIIHPGHWGCFGGALHPGELPLRALRRELAEELELEIERAEPFATFDFDLNAGGGPRFYRMYFEVRITEERTRRFVLHEGADWRIFDARQLLARERVSPHDAFAIWLHLSRRRIR